MTYLFNNPVDFRREFLLGLAAAHPASIRPIAGGAGVVSVTARQPGEVGVVIGGGSGHYPAFAGLVGPGLCDGAVVGEIFTSPSAQAVGTLIEATDSGRGVLLMFGNYSGDVMHFGLAAQRARRDGRDVRIVTVTDDVASAPPGNRASRRGVAGGLYVFRAAAAAARAGWDLDGVEAAARSANNRVFTFGLAFGGCTFPGAAEPLFGVEESSVALGLGIHGEPGVEIVPRQSASDLAALVIKRLLDERPKGAQRARLLVNGLGTVKYEELFVLTGSLLERLQAAGVTVVETRVGEFVTSLDMAGCSVSVCWTTPELDRLLETPVSTPGLVDCGSPAVDTPDVRELANLLQPRRERAASSAVRTPAAERAVRALSGAHDAISADVVRLGKLDAIVGDGDHGLGMDRGFGAAVAAAGNSGSRIGDVLEAAGLAFADVGGGASGALWGAGLSAVGFALNDGEHAAAAAQAGLAAVRDLGGAQVGDKTMVDAVAPFVDTLADELSRGASLAQSWRCAVQVADERTNATRELVSRRGRAALHAEHGLGVPDPGCVSFVTAVRAVGEFLDESAGVDR